MKVIKNLKKLCTPAMVYLVMSGLSFLAILMQNCQDSSSYKIGTMTVKPECHNAYFFLFKAMYILAFTYLLNYFCSKNLTTLSWILVLLPFIGMFLLLGLIMILLMSKHKTKEGFKEGANHNTPDPEGDDDEGEEDENFENFTEGLEEDDESDNGDDDDNQEDEEDEEED